MLIVNKKILYPFESFFSIIYKLTYIDKLDYQATLTLFGIKTLQSNSVFSSSNSRKLVKFFKIQPNMYYLYEGDVDSKEKLNISHVFQPENIVPFVYCPECAKHNYHAVFHTKNYYLCLIHGSTLTSICQSCKSKELTIKSGVIYCTKCKQNLYNEEKYIPDSNFKEIILKEIIPFQMYLNRTIKQSYLYDNQSINVCNVFGSYKFIKLLYRIKKYFFWAHIVKQKGFIHTSIDYSKISPLDTNLYLNTDEWLSTFAKKSFSHFKKVYLTRFHTLICNSEISSKLKSNYKSRSNKFRWIWKTGSHLGTRLRIDLKELESSFIYKHERLIPYILRKMLYIYLRLAYLDTVLDEKHFTQTHLRRAYIEYIYLYIFILDNKKVEIFIFEQNPMMCESKRFITLKKLEKKSNMIECHIYNIDIKAYVSSLYPNELFFL